MSAPQPSGARQEQSDGDFLSLGRSPQAHHQATAACASGLYSFQQEDIFDAHYLMVKLCNCMDAV